LRHCFSGQRRTVSSERELVHVGQRGNPFSHRAEQHTNHIYRIMTSDTQRSVQPQSVCIMHRPFIIPDKVGGKGDRLLCPPSERSELVEILFSSDCASVCLCAQQTG